jgi:predicted O-methyltransferase YrrM
MPSELRRLALGRSDAMHQEVEDAVEAQRTLRRAGNGVAEPVSPWMSQLIARCMESEDIHDSVDHLLDTVLTDAGDKVRFLILLADRFRQGADKMTSLHFLNTAREHALQTDDAALMAELARQLVEAGGDGPAMDFFIDKALAQALPGANDASLAAALSRAYQRARTVEQSRQEHGHELLLAHLRVHGAQMRAQAPSRKLTLVEIGTTRENVPGQGSTRKLAEYCKQTGMHFITVDMDPHNARMAKKLFDSLGVGFEAVAMKGEDFLRDYQGPLDLVFLDAFDFDHGQHSALRQSRYEKMLGTRIEDAACHQMHLDCAESVQRKLSPFGLVCVDDTWIEDGRWTAKGTLAMPFLLAQGFELVEGRNRAALLRRAPTERTV